jgi:hypothetical protein
MKFHHLAFTFALTISVPHALAAPAEKAAKAPQKSAPEGSYILATASPAIVAGQTYESTEVMKMEDSKFSMGTPQ